MSEAVPDPVPLAVVRVDETRKRSTVELLERALSAAKEGQVDGVFVVLTYPNSFAWREMWSDGLSKLDAVGRLEALKWALLHQPFEKDGECR